MITVFKGTNNLYFFIALIHWKRQKVLNSNRENLLYISGEALDSEATDATEKVV